MSVDDGTQPAAAEVVTDGQNGRSGRFSDGVGAEVQLADAAAALLPVTVSGRGDSLGFSEIAAVRVVLYASQTTVNELAGSRGVDTIELTVDDPARASEVADAVRGELLELHPEIVFTEFPTSGQRGRTPVRKHSTTSAPSSTWGRGWRWSRRSFSSPTR